MSRFAALSSSKPPSTAEEAPPTEAAKAIGREGKKAISGYFSREASRVLHMLALDQGVSLQALMGEAFDDLLRKYGRHPLGER